MMSQMTPDSDEWRTLEQEDPLLESLVIPDHVRNYVPTSTQLNTTTKGGHYIRYIFSNVQFTQFEQEHINAFKVFAIKKLEGPQLETEEAVDSFKKRFAGTAFADDGYLLRCLIGNNYIYDQAFDDMKENLTWRNNTLPIRRCEIEKTLSRGVVYVHGRDICMRPILVFQLSHVSKLPHEDVLRCFFFTLEVVIHKLMIPGRIEQWKVSLIKQIARALTVNYRGRLSQMYIINAPYIISGIWNLVKNVLPEVTQEKIQISSGRNTKKLLEGINPSQLEKKYGGTAANVTVYDIPVMPEM